MNGFDNEASQLKHVFWLIYKLYLFKHYLEERGIGGTRHFHYCVLYFAQEVGRHVDFALCLVVYMCVFESVRERVRVRLETLAQCAFNADSEM